MLYVDIEKHLDRFTLKAKISVNKVSTALLGASGAGKSMTLKCIAGIEKPDKGKIILNDTVLFDSEKRINLPPQKRRVGYLFQDYALFPNLSVLDNIRAGLHFLPRKQRHEAALRYMETFHLQGLENSRPSTLSGGEKQRVALARILASEPTVLLLDEPFSSLDTQLKWALEEELKAHLEGFNGDMMMITHNIDEALELCNDVYPIEYGVVSPKQSLTEYYHIILQKNQNRHIILSNERINSLMNQND